MKFLRPHWSSKVLSLSGLALLWCGVAGLASDQPATSTLPLANVLQTAWRHTRLEEFSQAEQEFNAVLHALDKSKGAGPEAPGSLQLRANTL